MEKPKSTNVSGVKYLSKGRPNKGLYAVKIEIASANGYHGKMLYFYEGNNLEYATALANKVNSLVSKARIDAINFHDYELKDWTNKWNEENPEHAERFNKYANMRR